MRTRNAALVGSLVVGLATGMANADALLNEFHYDNASSDVGEFIEVVLTGATAAADVDVYLYNGSDNEVYTSGGVPTPGFDLFNLAIDFTDHGVLGDGNHYYSLMLPSNGLQNGSPDGIAVTIGGVVNEFWSYEGTMTGSGSVADGILSTDVGASEPSSAPIGSSIQRDGLGASWAYTEGTNTKGDINVIPAPGALALLGLAALAGRRRRRA